MSSEVNFQVEWSEKYQQWYAVVGDNYAHRQYGETPVAAIESALTVAADELNAAIKAERETE